MFNSLFKTKFPPDLKKRHLIAVCADIRGSSQINEYPVEDTSKYAELKREFKDIATNINRDFGRCVLKFDAGQRGDDLNVSFFNHWPDIAVACAIYFSLSLHKKVLDKLENHGIAVGIHSEVFDESQSYEEVMSTAFTIAARLTSYVGKMDESNNFATKILVSKNMYDHLYANANANANDLQALFVKKGNHNIAKISHTPMNIELYEFNTDKLEPIFIKLQSFFRLGLIGILEDGLCPKKKDGSKINIDFLKYSLNSAFREINILQTYIPDIKNLEDEIIEAIKRKVMTKILLLAPTWNIKDDQIFKLLSQAVKKPKANLLEKVVTSPLAFQRGVDFDYPNPIDFGAEIIICANELKKIENDLKEQKKEMVLKEKLFKYYNATPSACLHLFDDILFVGHFLQKSYAVTSPHAMFLRGSTLFERFHSEFNAIWKKSNDNANGK